MPVPKGYKMPPSQAARHKVPTLKQRSVLQWLFDNPGASIADVCVAIDGFKKQEGSALYVTIRRMIRRGFLTTRFGKGTRYQLFVSFDGKAFL